MASSKAPKQWALTTTETINTVEVWKQNLIYILSLDNNFAPYLASGVSWKKKASANPTRGLTDDGATIAADDRRTAVQKCTMLELMLGQIANFCPVISRNSIVKQSTSLEFIWQRIRQYYGFQSTGAHFLDLASFKLEQNERPEALYERLMAFFEDNLLTSSSDISHHGSKVSEDEDMTPSLENTIIVTWLQLIHKGLPQLVKQRYGPELRNKSIASIKPEISQALPSLLDELRSIEDSKILRLSASSNRFQQSRDSSAPSARFQQSRDSRRPFSRGNSSKECSICKAAGRSSANTHFLSECKLLTESDKRYLHSSRARLVGDSEPFPDEELSDEFTTNSGDPSFEENAFLNSPIDSVRRVDVIQSPVLNCYYNNHPVKLIIDTGATTNLVTKAFAQSVNIPIKPSSQLAYQADGLTPLEVVGEIHCSLTRGDNTLFLNALVVNRLDTPVLVGNPFLVKNDIGTRPKRSQIIIGGSEIVYYGSASQTHGNVRRTQAVLIRAPHKQTVLLPGDYIDLKVPADIPVDSEWALEPRLDSPCNRINPDRPWPPPQNIQSVGDTLRVTNSTEDPILLKKDEHIAQIRATIPILESIATPSVVEKESRFPQHLTSSISIDPDHVLPREVVSEFTQLHDKYASVFSSDIQKYNGASGNIESCVNMGPNLPPQRKGRLPHYSRDNMMALQNKCDDLEQQGVLAKPEEVGITVEYLNLSFLVQKPSGGSRLVTSFGEVAQFSKPQPALMTHVDQVLRNISSWKYIIVTDLKQAYYQIPLAKASMKFCGIVTPFKGVRVYTRSAMGMPGSETALEELLSRVLGDFIMEGWCAKIADDLYIGGDTTEELLNHWSACLATFQKNNLGLNAPKTIISPVSTTILGWIWKKGTLRASTHKVSALASVEPPSNVQGLRSFIGAYKVLSRVLRGYAMLLDPLEKLTCGKQSRDKVEWSDTSLQSFTEAQKALSQCKTITLPKPEDTLWVVTDASVGKGGLAATLYACRDGQICLAGFFNAKQKNFQAKWLPCELEGLCIASAVQHFGPYILQSKHQAQVLTDSKPCVQAHQKLLRGEFSASARITSFLSVVSRFNMKVRHIAGIANLPSDYTSRNPPTCPDNSCQICKFVCDISDSVIRAICVKDVISGSVRMPFVNRAAWQATQRECPDLRRVHAHLSQGTRPGKKATKVKDVKRYLREAVIANDGLLVVPLNEPFQPERDRIVVPRSVIDGMITAIHLRFTHPSPHQMKQLIGRFFYALDLDKSIQQVYESCHHCMALKSVPDSIQPQVSEPPPDTLCISFALDVMRRYRQCILVLRECVSSFTKTAIIRDEKHETLRDAILCLSADFTLDGDSTTSIRVDPGPGLVALRNDATLQEHGIRLVVGEPKNVNKNPVAERAIGELGVEILKLFPAGGPLTSTQLAMATSSLNSRIRNNGLSSREIWTQRDQFTGQQLPIDDRQIIQNQYFQRTYNHNTGGKTHDQNHLQPVVGDLVYIAGDKDKTKARDRYLVVDFSDNMYTLRKFTKDQFRSKTYKIKPSQVYPVQSNVNSLMDIPPHWDQSEVAPLSESALPSDSTTGQSLTQTQRTLFPDLPIPPPEIVTPLDQAIPPDLHVNRDEQSLSDDHLHHNAHQNPQPSTFPAGHEPAGTTSNDYRRSDRKKSAPFWHANYLMYK